LEIVKALVIMSFLIPAISSFAAEPQLQFDLNRDSKSYMLRIHNPTDNAINCASLEITAEIGNSDCTRILPSDTQTLRNIKITAGGVILESNFGIDHLFFVNRNLKQEEKKVYCGAPEVKVNCQ
jgi:hypothetical protein